jgi:2-polyprenyl-3-methyl-5-hydroxy-6-metoxy-1,4-benzoquinol methylase
LGLMQAGAAGKDIARERDEIIARYGEWTDHNIHLGNGVYTIGEHVISDKLRRIVQIVSDMARRPLNELRIVDLACLEGQYAIEFARHGSQCVAIDGRETNLEKARFAKRALNLENLTLALDDVRNLSKDKYGTFDVVLCLGILYHLDGPSVLGLLERIGQVCTGIAVFDTYVSIAQKCSYSFQGKEYWGRDIVEHSSTASKDEKLRDLWASLDNATSFWITKNSLLNALRVLGFTSVYECFVPVEPNKRADRITLLAVKGQPQGVCNIPKMNEMPWHEMPEAPRYEVAPQQRPYADTSAAATRMVPRPLKRLIKAAVRKIKGDSGARPWEWARPWQRRRD